MKKLLIICLMAPSLAWAQNGLQLLENLKRIESTGTVLHVAAHPDDEGRLERGATLFDDLHALAAGVAVNLEIDLIARYVERMLGTPSPTVP